MQVSFARPPITSTGTKYQVEFRPSPSGIGGRYYLDGKITKRVTSVLEKFPDSGKGLIEWAKKRVAITAGRLLRDRLITVPETGKRVCYLSEEEIGKIVSEALLNPEKIKEETADTGTAVHAFIDEWLQGGATEELRAEICTKYLLPENPPLLEVLQKQAEVDKMDDATRNQFYDQMKAYMFDKFVRFWRKSGLKYYASEVLVGSLKYKYCGRLDILAEDKKGRLVLIDFKTSKWVSPSYFAQVAAYQIAFEEQYERKIDKCLIVQCPREWSEYNMGFGLYPVKTPKYKAIFLNILKYWDETEFEAAKCRMENWASA